MGSPSPGDVHVNQPLTNISIAYLQSADAFVADRVFPNIPVSKQSDRYYTYDRGEFNRDEMRKRAPGTESAGGSYKLDNTPTYFADEWGFHKDIPDQVRANADSVIQPDREATEYVTHKALIRKEKIFATNYFAASVWSYERAGAGTGVPGTSVTYWNNAASTPIIDVRLAKRVVQQNTGMKPNTLVLGKKTYDDLLDNPDIIERLDRGQTPGAPAMGSQDGLMRLFEIERLFVMEGIENTALENTDDYAHGAEPAGYFNHSFIGGRHALLCYSAPNPGLLTPSAGYTFSWTGLLGAGALGTRIRRFRIERSKVDRVEIEMAFDMKLVSKDLGFFFNNVVEADS